MKSLTSKKQYSSQALLASLLLASAGCGGGGATNDQGMSVTMTSYNSVDASRVCQPDVFSGGVVVSLSNADNLEGAVIGSQSCLTVRNNITTQGVRLERLQMEYYIEGASEQPPATTQAFGIVLGSAGPNGIVAGGGAPGGGAPGGGAPGGGAPGGGAPGVVTTGVGVGVGGVPGSDLPPAWAAIAQQYTGPFLAVPPEIGEWLAFHRESLPEPPFHMTLVTTAMGVTTAGDEVVTNSLPYLVVVQEDRIITPNSGTPSQPTADVGSVDQLGNDVNPDTTSDSISGDGLSTNGQGGAETL